MSAETLSLDLTKAHDSTGENKECFIAEAQEGRKIIVQPETKRARILHRSQSDGADDWEVFTSSNGDQYIASRQKMKPPRWVDELFKQPPSPPKSGQGDTSLVAGPSEAGPVVPASPGPVVPATPPPHVINQPPTPPASPERGNPCE